MSNWLLLIWALCLCVCSACMGWQFAYAYYTPANYSEGKPGQRADTYTAEDYNVSNLGACLALSYKVKKMKDRNMYLRDDLTWDSLETLCNDK